jgi:hypothetical protein
LVSGLGDRDFAAASARLIDDVFVGGMQFAATTGGGDLVSRWGRPAFGGLIDFRVPLRVGAVTWDGLTAVHRYQDLNNSRAALRAMADGGAITIDADGSFRATDRGQTFLAELTAHQQEASQRRWAGQPLGETAQWALELLAAAEPTGGPAFAAMCPWPLPAEPGVAVAVLNRIGTLRYHRADAHARAWAEAGLTATQIQELPPGPARRDIEERTNELAAAPYSGWPPARRQRWLERLAALT